MKQGEWVYYQVMLPEDLSNSDNLLVAVTAKDGESNPDIYISFTEEQPKDAEHSYKVCNADGGDTCLLDSSHLKQVQDDLKKKELIAYVGVKCESDGCNFQISASLKNLPTKLLMNQERDFYLHKATTKLFNFYIPAKSETGSSEDQEVESVTILAYPRVQNAAEQHTDITLTASLDKNQKDKFVLGDPVWTQGKAIRLSKNQQTKDGIKAWCTDCWITISLTGLSKGMYSITVKAEVGESQQINHD